MPDLEDLIRNTLDRQAPRPDPDPIVERVANRKRQVRLARRVQSATLAVVVVAGIAAGGYALARAFGVGEHPSPAVSVPTPRLTHGGPLPCGGPDGTLDVVSQEGAAGTIRTVWQFTNQGSRACNSIGYPTIEIHGPSGWSRLQLTPGGYADINGRPTRIKVVSGGSLYFVSYWSDVTTNTGPCDGFDRVRVTLPAVSPPLEVASAGCLNPDLVHIGPVSGSPPTG